VQESDDALPFSLDEIIKSNLRLVAQLTLNEGLKDLLLILSQLETAESVLIPLDILDIGDSKLKSHLVDQAIAHHGGTADHQALVSKIFHSYFVACESL